MAGTAAQKAEDDAAVEEQRAKFGDTEAARLAADLYKLRRTPAPAASGGWSGLPRGIIILIAIWVGLLETAEKLPFLLLSYPQYEATLAEIHAKMLQPDLVAAQLDKARADAKTAAIQPELTSVQLDRSKLETKAAAYQPDTAAAQLEKTKQEAKTAAFQPALTAAQAFKAENEAVGGGQILGGDGKSVTRLSNMFDLLDPNHPAMISRGIAEPDVSPLLPFVKLKKDDAPKPTETPTSTEGFKDQDALEKKMADAETAGDYATAFKVAQEAEAKAEAAEMKAKGALGELTGRELASIGWFGLFTQNFAVALEASERAIKLLPGDLGPVTNQAHALMFLGRNAEAKSIYLGHKGEKVDGRLWEKAIPDDFSQLRKAGVTNPMMDEIEAALK